MHRHPEIRKAPARFVSSVWRTVMVAAALASMPVQSFAADCVPAGGEDIDGNGLDDALVSVNAVVRNSDVACSTRIGAGARVFGARLGEASDGDDFLPTVVGSDVLIARGATLIGAEVGAGSVVLRDAILRSRPESEVVIGEHSVIGAGATIGTGDSPAELGAGAIVRRGAAIRGGFYGANLRVGAGAELFDVDAGSGVTVRRGASVNFDAGLDDGVVIGADAFIDSLARIATNAIVRRGARLGTNVGIGADTVVGAEATIGFGAEIGEGVRIGAGATIAEQAIVPDGTVVPAGASFP